jgi:hypothetical protein
MASKYGQIEPFEVDGGNFESYIERFEQFLKANSITADLKSPMFISHVGVEGYEILKNLCVPLNPSEKTYTDIVAILKGHFAPKRLIIVERFKFYKRDQLPNESIGNYIVELKKLSKGCEFGTFLKESLRDRLVCGLKDEQIQRKLLTETNLTFDTAGTTALSMEAAQSHLNYMHQASIGNINQFHDNNRKVTTKDSFRNQRQPNSQPRSTSSSQCFRCGRKHNPDTCPAKEWECFFCKVKGHTSKMCKGRRKNMSTTSKKKTRIITFTQ